jgi:hypothetical protein
MSKTVLKKGDRVVIRTTPQPGKPPLLRHGTIVGEGRGGQSWVIKRDDIKSLFGYHKSFCRPEIQDESGQVQGVKF